MAFCGRAPPIKSCVSAICVLIILPAICSSHRKHFVPIGSGQLSLEQKQFEPHRGTRLDLLHHSLHDADDFIRNGEHLYFHTPVHQIPRTITRYVGALIHYEMCFYQALSIEMERDCAIGIVTTYASISYLWRRAGQYTLASCRINAATEFLKSYHRQMKEREEFALYKSKQAAYFAREMKSELGKSLQIQCQELLDFLMAQFKEQKEFGSSFDSTDPKIDETLIHASKILCSPYGVNQSIVQQQREVLIQSYCKKRDHDILGMELSPALHQRELTQSELFDQILLSLDERPSRHFNVTHNDYIGKAIRNGDWWSHNLNLITTGFPFPNTWIYTSQFAESLVENFKALEWQSRMTRILPLSIHNWATDSPKEFVDMFHGVLPIHSPIVSDRQPRDLTHFLTIWRRNVRANHLNSSVHLGQINGVLQPESVSVPLQWNSEQIETDRQTRLNDGEGSLDSISSALFFANGEDSRLFAFSGNSGIERAYVYGQVHENNQILIHVIDVISRLYVRIRQPDLSDHQVMLPDGKNWTPFEYQGSLHFIFTFRPVKILKCPLFNLFHQYLTYDSSTIFSSDSTKRVFEQQPEIVCEWMKPKDPLFTRHKDPFYGAMSDVIFTHDNVSPFRGGSPALVVQDRLAVGMGHVTFSHYVHSTFLYVLDLHSFTVQAELQPLSQYTVQTPGYSVIDPTSFFFEPTTGRLMCTCTLRRHPDMMGSSKRSVKTVMFEVRSTIVDKTWFDGNHAHSKTELKNQESDYLVEIFSKKPRAQSRRSRRNTKDEL